MTRRSLVSMCSVALVAGGLLVAAPAATAHGGKKKPEPVPCANLAALDLPQVIAISSQSVPAGTFVPPAGAPVPDLPPFCRVSLTIAPAINVEVWLPAEWNGRFQAVGGGGYAGNISWGALGTALRAGYATTSTDTGHSSATQPGGSFGLNADGSLNWGLITDFASRSLIEMTRKAKALIQAHYAQKPAYSYWNGCSTGGRQGLIQVQRTPDAYDGLLTAAPAINWDRFIPAELWPALAMKEEAGGPIAACKLTAVNNAAVAACDALDGVADGVLENPRQCRFDPKAIQCASGAPSDCNCLTAGEVSAVRKIWDGARDTRGRRLWYGLEPGASFGGLAGTNPFSISTDHHRLWIERDPTWDWHTLDYAGFAENFKLSRLLFNRVIGSDDPDLKDFRKAGGKVLIWHGWSDQLIFPRGTIDYYERLLEENGGEKKVHKFARLFMAPGVAHCGGGTGPVVSNADLFQAVVDWVEHDQAPERLTASFTQGGQVIRTRPWCLYPKVAVYTGSGSTDDAANFVCRSVREHGHGHGHGHDKH